MSALETIQQDLENIAKNPPDGVVTAGPSGDDLLHWTATLTGPDDSPYAGGVFHVSLRFDDTYPQKAPLAQFTTRVYHPNIHTGGGVRPRSMREEWTPDKRAPEALSALRALLANPDLDDTIHNQDAAHVYRRDRTRFTTTAQEWTRKYAQ
ncbi:hypothetical protein ADK70_38610 [Streptomyces rimosus subsp. pseudoverticillatus]|uniref:ubiquitin-conjugating enzyme E2 n=1 Tax=Streptomyces rimosus TaxID=1927 RepID=UPI0006B26888|nr:ubiquitin-conjugating enzyme E2 [Streptomyces rimosus]KOT76386.1 hypothetical protein ADK70_38610 [Streptomyces rimosus subsp. pseudoverticillatus]